MTKQAFSVCVILPAFGRENAVACVRFLRENEKEGVIFHFIVVDNGNNVPLSTQLATLAGEDCEVIRLRENQGGAGAFRAGMQQAMKSKSDFTWLLDDDAELNPGTFSGLLSEYLRLECSGVRVGAVGSVQLGTVNRGAITEAGGRLSPITGRYLRGHVGECLPEIPWTEEVGYLPATSLLMRTGVLRDVGPFEPVFIHCDDIDWGYRARARGWHLFVTTHSVIHHPEWSSKPQTWVIYYDVRNLLWCLKRHLPFAAYISERLRYVQMGLYRLHGRKSIVKLMCLGLQHARTGKLLTRRDLPDGPSWLTLQETLADTTHVVVMSQSNHTNLWKTRLEKHPLTILPCDNLRQQGVYHFFITAGRQFIVQLQLWFSPKRLLLIDCACTKYWPFPLFAKNKVFYWETTQGLQLFREGSPSCNKSTECPSHDHQNKDNATSLWGPWGVSAVLTVVGLALTTLWVGVQADVLYRYAPMAEAFAEGNWLEAFHPRFGVGMPTVAGSLVWLIGCDGLTACAWVALIAWALCVPPLFAVAERVFGRATAWMATLLYAICPMTFYWALCGLREPFRTLGVLCAILAILQRREGMRWRSLWPLLAALPALCIFRSDTLAIGGALLLVYGLYDRLGTRFLLAMLWMAAWLQPGCLLTWKWLGLWLPSTQIAGVWLRLFGGTP